MAGRRACREVLLLSLTLCSPPVPLQEATLEEEVGGRAGWLSGWLAVLLAPLPVSQ